MTRPVLVTNASEVTSPGVVAMENKHGHQLQKVPTNAHNRWSVTTIESGGEAAVLELKGTNNEDPNDSNGETLLTITHSGNDQQDMSAWDIPYQYLFIEATSAPGNTSFTAGTGITLHGTSGRTS